MASKHRYLVLDGLRGVAALAVLLLHSVGDFQGHDLGGFGGQGGGKFGENPLVHAHLAVDFFFVLSGFVIGHAYDEKLQTGRLTFWDFVRVRLIRLYPLIVLGTAIAGLSLLVRIGVRNIPALVNAAALILGNLTLVPLPVQHLAPPGFGERDPYLNPPEWSLLFEFAVNFAYAAVAPRLKSTHLVAIALLGAAGLVVNAFLDPHLPTVLDMFVMGTPRVLFSFSVGLLIYKYAKDAVWRVSSAWSAVLAVILLLVLLSPHFFKPLDSLILTILVLPAIVLVGAHLDVGRTGGVVADWCGRLSYPVYILHRPLSRILNHITLVAGLSETARFFSLIVEIPIVVLMAWLALVFFDEPVRRAWTAAARRSSPKLEARPAPGEL